MSATSIETAVRDFLQRALVEPRTRGGQETEVESASLLESMALAFLLTPKTALYFALVARNKLVAAATTELSAIGALRSAISDLGNIAYAVQDTRALERARIALLQIESSEHVSVTSGSFKQFENSVNDFVNNQLAKNVKRIGSPSLVRPGIEAKADIPGLFSAIQDAHTDFLDRLYALEVGIDNFLSSPFGTIIGLATVARVRHDLADIIQSFEDDPSAAQSRDATLRLMSAKAAVSLLGSAPDIAQPVLSTALSLPPGYELTAKSLPVPPAVIGTPGPWTLPVAASLTIDAVSATLFPQVDVDNANAAVLVGTAVSFPISVIPGESLFLRVAAAAAYDGTFTKQSDGSYTSSVPALGAKWDRSNDGVFEKSLRLNLNPLLIPSSISLATCLSLLSTLWSTFGSTIEYIGPGLTGRILIRANTTPGYLRSLAIVPIFTDIDPLSTVGASRIFTNSAHEKLGFSLGQTANAGTTSVDYALDAVAAVFSSVVTASRTVDGALSLTSTDDSPGKVLTVSGSPTLGLEGSFRAVSNTIQLFGKVQGVDDGFPVAPGSLVDVSDLVTTPTGTARIESLSDTSIVLSTAVQTFDGPITVESSLYRAWSEMSSLLHPSVESWLNGAFAANLDVLDRAVAPLRGSTSKSQQNEALRVLDQLESALSDLISALTTVAAVLPAGAGEVERATARGILSLLAERHYDRAADLLSRCQIREVLALDWQSASFGGAFLQATSDFARSDLRFVNKARDEGAQAKAVEERTEFPP